jgi:hypothetical protein
LSKPKNAFEIFQFLDKSNCRECGEKTCLAFAGAVFMGQRKIRDCPKISPEAIERFAGESDKGDSQARNSEDRLAKLKSQITQLDLSKAAERVGAAFSGHKLTLKVLGKDFSVDAKENLFAEIHINPWVAVPFLDYILHGKGFPASGKWVHFRELEGGRELYPLFKSDVKSR